MTSAALFRSPSIHGKQASDVYGRTLTVITITIILLVPALLNGFPFVFPDTGTYLRAAVEGWIPEDRPVFYSLFALSLHLRLWPWPVIVVQSAIVAVLVEMVGRILFDIRTRIPLLIASLVLALASSLPWFAGQLMPDIFTSTLILALLLAGMAWDRLAPWERAFALLLIIAGITFHYGNVLIALASAPAFLAMRLSGWKPGGGYIPRFLAIAVAISVGVVALFAMTYVRHGRVQTPSASSVFMIAKLIDDGSAIAVLERDCPTENWSTCGELADMKEYGARKESRPHLPTAANHFLWGGGVKRLGGFAKVAVEAPEIIARALRIDPWGQFRKSLADAVALLTRFQIGTAHMRYGTKSIEPTAISSVFGASTAAAALGSHQAQGTLPLETVNTIHKIALLLSVGTLIVLAAISWQSNQTAVQASIGLGVFLLANAVVMGALSGVHDRYQSRVMWFLPLFALLMLLAWSHPSCGPAEKRR